MLADKHVSRCPLTLNRRRFLKGLGASAVAMQMGLFEFASSLMAAAPQTPGKCRIMGAFVRPDVDKYWLGWPGTAYDIKGHQELYTKRIVAAAEHLGVALDLSQEPIHNDKTLTAYLEKVKKAAPDGVLLTCMSLNAAWKPVNKFLDTRGEVPTVVFSPMGTSFTGHLQHGRNAKNAFVGATQDVEWLATAVRMLKTVWEMKQTRICIVRGNKVEDKPLDVIGTTLHYVPHQHFLDAFKKVEESDEVRAMADYYTKEAKKIVEPSKDDILTAAKNYIVCRRLMETEKCHGFSMDCLGPIGRKQIKPPCLAFMRLRDEGIVGACEADWNACISSRLTHLLFQRPGFMQDPAPNTVNNTLMAAHCTCGAHLDGFDKPHEPFILRSHSESDIGVAVQVLWRVGQKITLMKFTGPQKIILGTGRVLRNIDTPPSGGCRTSLECEVDDVPDSRDIKGFHQLLIYGDLEDEFKAYCQLSGIEVIHI